MLKGNVQIGPMLMLFFLFLSLQLQPNPVLTIPESLLQEEEEPMATTGAGGEEEEGMISDPGTEIMSVQDEKVKVRTQ